MEQNQQNEAKREDNLPPAAAEPPSPRPRRACLISFSHVNLLYSSSPNEQTSA
jgi:hypothetical protein